MLEHEVDAVIPPEELIAHKERGRAKCASSNRLVSVGPESSFVVIAACSFDDFSRIELDGLDNLGEDLWVGYVFATTPVGCKECSAECFALAAGLAEHGHPHGLEAVDGKGRSFCGKLELEVEVVSPAREVVHHVLCFGGEYAGCAVAR